MHLNFDSPPKTIFPYSNLIIHLENGGLYNGATLIGSGYGSRPFSCVEYNNIWHGVNKDNQLRYDGTNVHAMGNAAPDAAPTVADEGSAGNPNGTYYYKIAMWLETGSDPKGSFRIGYDNAKVQWKE